MSKKQLQKLHRVRRKHTYLYILVHGKWGNSELNQDEESEKNISSVYQMDILILGFYSGNSIAFI